VCGSTLMSARGPGCSGLGLAFPTRNADKIRVSVAKAFPGPGNNLRLGRIWEWPRATPLVLLSLRTDSKAWTKTHGANRLSKMNGGPEARRFVIPTGNVPTACGGNSHLPAGGSRHLGAIRETGSGGLDPAVIHAAHVPREAMPPDINPFPAGRP